ncbi:glycoside hydrolase family 61 protein [Microthyrium microscopicum]|uniref:lytic cellulose monooxygenase (C4-dehydrogenating) n=1 Tax=Microthyrium microscopicum TaxID=703497 RepID=A0A6A6UDZ7_9PEZI|nr:glycoside hydrolase family 61 protein [Microthyrium microscopicum]
MKLSVAAALVLAPYGVLSHYAFWRMVVNGTTTGEWEYLRRTAGEPGSKPLENPSAPGIRCYEDGSHKIVKTATVAAGSKIGFKASNTMGHPGPFTFYMAKAPTSVERWDGSGNVWFKIDEIGATADNAGLHFKMGLSQVDTVIPRSVPAGEYLIRVEHIALHKAGQPQFYISCGQIRVTGGGSGNPSPKVSFPGAYKMSDPGFSGNIYKGTPTSYPMPGPPVWKG